MVYFEVRIIACLLERALRWLHLVELLNHINDEKTLHNFFGLRLNGRAVTL